MTCSNIAYTLGMCLYPDCESRMQELFKTVYRLDANDRIQELIALVQQPHLDSDEVFYALTHSLIGERLRLAYLLAMLLANRGFFNPTIALSLCAGGLLFNNAPEMARGVAWLHANMDNLPDTQLTTIFNQVVAPAITHLLKNLPTNTGHGTLSAIFDLMTTAIPNLRNRFDLRAPVLTWSHLELQRLGRAQYQPLSHPTPLTNNPRQQRRVVVVMRTKIYPKHLWPSYPWDLSSANMEPHQMAELRLVAAMNGYGWQAELCHIKSVDQAEDCRTIINTCMQQPPDILVIDERFISARQKESCYCRIYIEMLAILRQTHPSLKVVMTLLDIDSIDEKNLIKVAPLLDAVWGTTSPSHQLWSHPALANKVLHLPIPHAGHETPPSQPLDASMWLDESLTSYRKFWLAAAQSFDLRIQKKEITPCLDVLPPMERYELYRKKLAATQCCLRFAAHPARSSLVTDLSFETLLSGALLVQEAPSDLRHYFIPGEHYLEFFSLAELRAISNFITHNRQEAEEIRLSGHMFASKQYSDAKLIDHLDALLYLPQKTAASLTTNPDPTQLEHELISYEYLSVDKWCRPASPGELLTKSGNLVCHFDDLIDPQPPLDLGLHLRGEGYEDLFPCTDEQVAAFIYYYDFRTRSVAPRSPFIARLENVRIEFPGFGVFLDRHLMLEESFHHKFRTMETIAWFGQATKRSVAKVEIPFELGTGFGTVAKSFQIPININYFINSGVDQYIDGPAIMLSGPSWANWHHWFIEMLPKLWSILAIPELNALPLILRAPLLPFQAESLQALGIPLERIKLFTGRLLHVNTLIFPSHISPENYALKNISWLRNNLLPAFGINTSTPAHELIYLSREQFPGQPARILNENAVRATLEVRGFKVVYPEQMTVKDQLELFNRARFIVAPFGSGGTNIVFCQPGTIFIELMSASFPQFINMYYTSLNHCHYGCLMNSMGNQSGIEMLIDVDALARVVDKALHTLV